MNNSAIPFPAKQARANLDIPRFCTTRQFAALFGFTEHWFYKLKKRGKAPPILTGVRPYRIDTQSTAFQNWLENMGVDLRHDSVDTAGK